MTRLFIALTSLVVAAFAVAAESASVKIHDISTKDDTSITIKKGVAPNSCVEYTIIEGQDDLAGEPDYQKKAAYQSWKAACAEWKKNLKETNSGNSILTSHCSAPTATHEADQWLYKGIATYKIKTKIRDKN